jgi:predicted NBD/HSP70 family sugar kinase
MKTQPVYLVLDINHSKTTIAIMNANKQLAYKSENTAATMEAGIRKIKKDCKQLMKSDQKINQVICSVPKPNMESGSFTDYRMLPWNNQPLIVHLSHAFNCPVKLVNRYALEALGEAVFGAGKSENVVMYYHLGSNVSGTCVVEQKLRRSLLRYRPEQQLIAQSHGNYQTLEELISLRNMEEQLARSKETINKAKLIEAIEHNLAVGLFNSLTHYEPGIIILGGSLTPELSMKKIKGYLEIMCDNEAKIPKIIRSEKSGFGPLYGALALIRAEDKPLATTTNEDEK